jgi:lipid-binding SYLF domain-containing protein
VWLAGLFFAAVFRELGGNMKSIVAAILVLAFACSVSYSRHYTNATTPSNTVYGEQEQIIERLRKAGDDLKELMNAPDSSIPKNVLVNAECVVVVPGMTEGGFSLGANHGRGVGTCRTETGWSQPAFFTITGGNWGASIGLESVDLVLIFVGDAGRQQLLRSQFKMGETGVGAGPVGRDAQADTDLTKTNTILVYSRTKGMFAGVDLSNASVKPDDDSTRAYYGKQVSVYKTLTGQGPRNENSHLFLSDVRNAFRESRTATSSSSTYIPTRSLLSAKFPAPKGLGAYGYVVFTKKPSTLERKRFESLCNAYVENLQSSSDFTQDSSLLMVTFWPVQKQVMSPKTADCTTLINFYDYSVGARIASSIGRSGSTGPLLVAWRKEYGAESSGQSALVFDLSDFDDTDLDRAMHLWKDRISREPQYWNGTGWSVIKFREAVRNLVEHYGEQIILVIQAK